MSALRTISEFINTTPVTIIVHRREGGRVELLPSTTHQLGLVREYTHTSSTLLGVPVYCMERVRLSCAPPADVDIIVQEDVGEFIRLHADAPEFETLGVYTARRLRSARKDVSFPRASSSSSSSSPASEEMHADILVCIRDPDCIDRTNDAEPPALLSLPLHRARSSRVNEHFE